MRKRDINIGGGVFHVILRGFTGGLIFKCDDDKIKFLRLLKRFLDKDNSVIYAFVLMDNHAHLLLKTYLLSPLMRNFTSSYSRWFNRDHNRKGKLFEKPFTSFVKNDEAWKVDCLRYI